MQIVVMLAIWVVLGLLIGILAGSIWKGEKPYGEVADYAIAIAASVITGLAGWFVMPMIGIQGSMRFIVAVTEPPLVALFVLWVLRRVKKST
jgi:uncharacterized membrane protein YeaQ/YmgE (transglycosylase-associated protein family)